MRQSLIFLTELTETTTHTTGFGKGNTLGRLRRGGRKRDFRFRKKLRKIEVAAPGPHID